MTADRSSDILSKSVNAQEQQQNSKPPGRPWPKGVSGNPGGRRKGCASLKAALKRALSRSDADAIAQKLIASAKAGNVGAAKLLLNHLPDCENDDPLSDILSGY